MFNIAFALGLMWLGALTTYLSSEKQQLVSKPLPIIRAWLVLFICIAGSSYFLSNIYAPLTSVIFSFGALMLSWIVLILLGGHWRMKFYPVSFGGFLFLMCVAQFGGA